MSPKTSADISCCTVQSNIQILTLIVSFRTKLCSREVMWHACRVPLSCSVSPKRAISRAQCLFFTFFLETADRMQDPLVSEKQKKPCPKGLFINSVTRDRPFFRLRFTPHTLRHANFRSFSVYFNFDIPLPRHA